MKTLRHANTKPLTQKAKGIRALETSCNVKGITNKHYLLQDNDDLNNVLSINSAAHWSSAYGRDTIAIRPAPPRARHGYFETERAEGIEEIHGTIKRKYEQVKSDHPDAEVLIAPWIYAESSGVLTDSTFAFGKSNDGATSGKDAVQLRIAPSGERFCNQLGYSESVTGIEPHEGAYVEYVVDPYEGTRLTQLRGGPKLDGFSNFIPSEGVKVERVVMFDQAITHQEWEATVPLFEPGTVVYHEGGAVSSHPGIHCVLHNVAYVVDKLPEIGKKLEPQTDVQQTDIEALRHGLKWGFAARREFEIDYKDMLHLSLFALHNYGADRSAISSYALGLGATYVWRLIASACAGEIRHGVDQVTASPLGEVTRLAMYSESSNFYRDTIYSRAFNADDNTLEQFVIASAHSYLYDFWNVGYGGYAWAECAIAALSLRDAIMAVIHKPTKKRVVQLIAAYNKAVHVAHNNGSPLTKFATCSNSEHCMNYAAVMNRRWLLTDAAPSLGKVLTRIPDSTAPLTKMTSTWRNAIPHSDTQCIINGGRAAYEQKMYEQRFAVECLARGLGKVQYHMRCECKNCSPHLHHPRCEATCRPGKRQCRVECRERHKRSGRPYEFYCNCNSCEIGETVALPPPHEPDIDDDDDWHDDNHDNEVDEDDD